MDNAPASPMSPLPEHCRYSPKGFAPAFFPSLTAGLGAHGNVVESCQFRQCLMLTKSLLLDCIAPISATIGTSPSGTSGTVRLN